MRRVDARHVLGLDDGTDDVRLVHGRLGDRTKADPPRRISPWHVVHHGPSSAARVVVPLRADSGRSALVSDMGSIWGTQASASFLAPAEERANRTRQCQVQLAEMLRHSESVW